MIMVYPKFYFIPVINEVNIEEEDMYRESDEAEEVLAIKKEVSKEDNYNKLLDEVDNEFINEELSEKQYKC